MIKSYMKGFNRCGLIICLALQTVLISAAASQVVLVSLFLIANKKPKRHVGVGFNNDPVPSVRQSIIFTNDNTTCWLTYKKSPQASRFITVSCRFL